MPDRRRGLALLAGEGVVVALALVLATTGPAITLVGVHANPIPPAVLGGAIVALGTGLGALRTATTTGWRAALGELGLGVALAVAIGLGATPLALAGAVAIALASASLRVDTDHVHAVTDA